MDIRDLITPNSSRQEKAVRSPAPVPSPRPRSHRGNTPQTAWAGSGGVHGNGTGPRQTQSQAQAQAQTQTQTQASQASQAQIHTPNSGRGPQTPSTPGIDALVEAAHIKRAEPSPSTAFPIVPPAAAQHNTPTPRPSGYDGAAEPVADAPRRDFSSTCLSPEAQQTAAQLYSNIQKNHYAYEDRVNFIRLLHQGFVDHIYPPASPDSHGDPHRFDVLKDLKAAREELDSLFAIGEDLWAEWIQDESLLARTVNERIAVMELCRRSVEEEYGSTKLWVIYGEWMLYLYKASAGDRDGSGRGHWSDEDRIIGREVFTWQSVVEVWKAGADATKWRINDCHLVWNRYLELLMQDVDASPSQERVSQLRVLFESRLQTPHAGWDDTFQLFSNFVSKYYNANYEDLMVDARSKAAEAKAMYAARETREAALHRTIELKDTNAEWTTFQEYLDWELSKPQRRKGQQQQQQLQPLRLELITSLYQRAVLRFPTDATLWEDYVMFLIDESMDGPMGVSPIPVIERATRHCPWSGALWSQLFISAERAGLSFAEILELKHKATRSGLLDAAGINEVLKVHTTWCSYLRRWALQPESTDEDLDVAEVGIRSAIESVQELGDKTDKAVPNDPLFHLERIYIRYLSARGSWDSAREEFKHLIPRHGHSFEFWLAYYTWELLSWSKFMPCDSSASASRRMPNPSYATAVLKQALQRTDLDWPEKIMDAYISHCEHYEDADESQLAIIDVRKAMKALTKRRQREALQQQQQQQQQQQPGEQQPFHHQVPQQPSQPMSMNGYAPTPEMNMPMAMAVPMAVPMPMPIPMYQHQRHMSHPPPTSATPLSQIPERAIHAAPFQPVTYQQPGPGQQPAYYGQPYHHHHQHQPQQHPPHHTHPHHNQYAAAAAAVPPATGTEYPYTPGGAAPGTVAHESNGTVYYYDASQVSAPGSSSGTTTAAAVPPAGGVLGMGGMMTPPGATTYYYPHPPHVQNGPVYYQ